MLNLWFRHSPTVRSSFSNVSMLLNPLASREVSTRNGVLFPVSVPFREVTIRILPSLVFWTCLLYGMFVFSSRGEAYEWIDVVQDTSPLRISTEILKHSQTDFPEGGKTSFYSGMEKNWFLRKRYIAIGDRHVADGLLSGLQERMIDLGVFRLRSYAASLLREASYLAEGGEYDQAIVLSKKAEQFAPSIPETHERLARIYWMRDKRDLLDVGLEWFQALKTTILKFEYASVLFLNLVLLLLVATTVFFGLFYLIQMVRYSRVLLHDLEELFRGRVGKPGLILLLGFLLLLPVLMGRGPYVVCVVWLFLFWNYANRKEKILHVLFLLFTAVAPLWLGVVRQGNEVLNGERFQAVFQHRDGISDDACVAGLLRLARVNPKDDAVFFMLGTAFKKRGEYEKARAALERAIAMDPSHADYYNNLGNTLYAEKEFKRAVRMYEKAIALDPDSAAGYFNLSAVHRELFLLKKSDQEYYKAHQLDPERVSHYVTILGPNYNRMVIDESFSDSWLWRTFLHALVPLPLWGGAGNGVSRTEEMLWVRSLVFLLLLFPLHYGHRFLGLARQCEKCGSIFCRRCQRIMRKSRVCSQCVYVFEDQPGIGVKQRTRKIIEIRRHRDVLLETGRLLGILLPGGGYLYFGRMVSGFLMLFVFVSGTVYAFFGEILSRFPMADQAGTGSGRLPGLVVAVLFYGLSILHVYRFRR